MLISNLAALPLSFVLVLRWRPQVREKNLILDFLIHFHIFRTEKAQCCSLHVDSEHCDPCWRSHRHHRHRAYGPGGDPGIRGCQNPRFLSNERYNLQHLMKYLLWWWQRTIFLTEDNDGIRIMKYINTPQAGGAHILAIGVLQGLAAGTLLYITFYEVLLQFFWWRFSMRSMRSYNNLCIEDLHNATEPSSRITFSCSRQNKASCNL